MASKKKNTKNTPQKRTSSPKYQSASSKPKKRLMRGDDRVLGGVCSGIAEYLDADPTVVRLLWALLTVFTAVFPGVILYIIAWIIIPKKRH